MSEYSIFVKDMAYIRTEKDYVGGVRNILNGNGKISVTNEEAKAFLIHLTISSLGISSGSDIVLCSFGLLAGYERIEGVTGRRMKYMEESGYQGKKTTSTKGRSPEEKSKDLIGKENNLYERIERNCSQISDIVTFFEVAKDRYLEPKPNRRGIRRVILPRPSYQTGVPMPLNNLPLANRGFMGREDILAALAEQFKTGSNIQLVYGMGGVGKSQIALHYAYTHLKDYDTVAWIDATSAITLHSSCLELLRRIDPALTPATEDAIRSMFLSYFERGTDWLLIFDNADYLDGDTDESMGARDLLESYLPKNAGHILITTRCNRDFANANRVPINVFAPELAVEFLEKRTGQKPDKDAERLAERLGYLPLALEYAGSYIKQHTTYAGYLEIWQEYGMELFDQENAGYAEQTVRKAFRITLDKLKSKYSGSRLRNVLDFLLICAVMDLDRLPMDAFVKSIADETERTIAYYNNPTRPRNGQIGRIRSSDDGEYVSPGSTLGEILVGESLLGHANNLLTDLIRRNEIIRIAAEYSLVGWDRREVFMHPLLRVIIREEFRSGADNNWAYNGLDKITLSIKTYEFDGNTELARRYMHKQKRHELEKFISSLEEIPFPDLAEDQNFWASDASYNLYEFGRFFIGTAECDADDLFVETLISLYRYLEWLYQNQLSASAEKKIRKEEEDVFVVFAALIGSNIIYRSFNLSETYRQTGKRYRLEYVRTACSETEPVKLENSMLIYFDDVHEARMKIPSLIADEDTDWRIIVLPDGMEYEV